METFQKRSKPRLCTDGLVCTKVGADGGSQSGSKGATNLIGVGSSSQESTRPEDKWSRTKRRLRISNMMLRAARCEGAGLQAWYPAPLVAEDHLLRSSTHCSHSFACVGLQR